MSLLLLSALLPFSAAARRVAEAEAAEAAVRWVSRTPNPLGARLSGAPAGQTTVHTVRGSDGEALFHAVQLTGGGIVVTAAETGIEPIVAFSDARNPMASEDSPLCAILALDLAARMEQVRRARSFKRAMPSGAADAIAEAESAWTVLLSEGKFGRFSISDMRVPPLLETSWGQGADSNGHACANYYTPNGYICGCVALVGAQIARFWRFPTESRPSVNRTCYVSGRGQTFATMGGIYSWSDMPPTFSALSSKQREAIGKLCYDFGVATYMDWGPWGSGAGGFCLDDAFTTVFGYANSRVYVGEQGGAFTQGVIEKTVLANLDAGCPVALGIEGHEVVADGYGYASGTLYTHLNLGWNGDDDAWYHLPVVDGYTYRSTVLDEVVYNVFPEKTGDLLTGRVLDESGLPVAGATVSAGGATATTNGRGIWALWVQGGTTWDVEVRMGRLSAGGSIDVARSVSSTLVGDSVWAQTGTPGNSWGNDIVLPGLVTEQPLPVFRFYSKNYNGHFFTIDEKEKNDLVAHNPNWKFEEVAYLAFMVKAPETVALHRFYSKGYRGHFFTIDEEEMRTVRDTNPNWKYEGVAYFVYPEQVGGSVPVYRFWSKAYRHHFYTTSVTERDDLIANNPNWKYETIAFWALPAAETGSSATASTTSRALAAATRGSSALEDGPSSPQTEGKLSFGERASCPFPPRTGGTPVPQLGGAAVGQRASCPFPLRTGGTPVPPSQTTVSLVPWSLAALPGGAAVAIPGETDLGDVFVETRGDAPEFADLWFHAEDIPGSADFQSADFSCAACGEVIPLRLSLPEGLFDAQLWSLTEGVLDEAVEGTFDFELPSDGAWRWLRVRDVADGDVFTLWLRVE